jgi:hypothetical protein
MALQQRKVSRLRSAAITVLMHASSNKMLLIPSEQAAPFPLWKPAEGQHFASMLRCSQARPRG